MTSSTHAAPPCPSMPPRSKHSGRERHARRLERRQRLRRGLILGSLVGLVATGYVFLGSWVRHSGTALALGTSGFTVTWRPDLEGWPWQGSTAVHCAHHGVLSRPHDQELTLLRDLKNVEELNLAECPISEKALAVLDSLPGLRDLNLSRVNHLRYDGGSEGLGDGCLVAVASLSHLERLSLAGNPISDAGLKRLSGLSELEDLDLSATEVTDAGLEHLRRLRNLASLNLGGTRVTPEGIRRFQAARPNVELSLDIDPRVLQVVQRRRSRQP